MNQFETAVIGGGPGGYIAAIRSAQLGKKTVIVENRDMGGTCLNRGCIPTKALLHSAETYHSLKKAKSLGITLGDYSFQYKKMAKRKDKVVRTLRSGVENLLAGNGVTIVKGTAVLTDSHTFRVDDTSYTADNIILATGSAPADIPIPGADHPDVLNSDGVLGLSECPDSVIIIGGGVIGVEFASLFSDLGKQVTIIEMMPSILFGNDDNVCGTMTWLMEEKGIQIHTNAKVLEIKDGTSVVFEENGTNHTVDAKLVIMAIGRKPLTQGIGLESAGVLTNERGFIPVNDRLETNIANIYAIGDITGKIKLAHVASAQGIVAAHNAAGDNRQMDYLSVPSCIYTTPEIACVGMTETAAKANGITCKTGFFDISGNGRSLAIDSPNGFVKLITDAATDKIIGCHMINAHATEMIGEVTVAIQNGLTAAQLGDSIHAHPTVSEAIMEAAHDIHNLCCHKL